MIEDLMKYQVTTPKKKYGMNWEESNFNDQNERDQVVRLNVRPYNILFNRMTNLLQYNIILLKSDI